MIFEDDMMQETQSENPESLMQVRFMLYNLLE